MKALGAAMVPPALVVGLVFALQVIAGLSPARGLGLLVVAQMSTIISLSLFSRKGEEDAGARQRRRSWAGASLSKAWSSDFEVWEIDDEDDAQRAYIEDFEAATKPRRHRGGEQ